MPKPKKKKKQIKITGDDRNYVTGTRYTVRLKHHGAHFPRLWLIIHLFSQNKLFQQKQRSTLLTYRRRVHKNVSFQVDLYCTSDSTLLLFCSVTVGVLEIRNVININNGQELLLFR